MSLPPLIGALSSTVLLFAALPAAHPASGSGLAALPAGDS